MTVRQAFETVLVELNKVQAPSLLLDDFVYLFNKSIQKYINKRYNLFETTQQLTDDLRVLVKTQEITNLTQSQNNVFGASYNCVLPDDYMHILNCICTFISDKRCDNCEIHVGANKVDSAEWPHIINNYYMKPSMKRPYYYISNVVDPIINTNYYKRQDHRQGNSYLPVMQIKCGKLPQKNSLKSVYVDYLRTPKTITLTQDQLDEVTDNTELLEFPDYVIYEIINEMTTLILENSSSPRVQTQPVVAQSVGPVANSRS